MVNWFRSYHSYTFHLFDCVEICNDIVGIYREKDDFEITL